VLNRLDPRIDRVRGETEPYSREQLLAACDLKPLEALRAIGSTRCTPTLRAPYGRPLNGTPHRSTENALRHS
jgi:hypothetical protein